MHILLVEDDRKMVRYLKRGLTDAGFVVDCAHSGLDGLHHARTLEYQLVILEVDLPSMNGWDLLRELRRTHDTPVIFLTACQAVEDRIKGLELGADDYVIKPFSFAELVSRIRCLLRRSPLRVPGAEGVGGLLAYEDVQLDLLRRRVMRAGRRIALTAKEFSLLHAMMSRPCEVMSRAQIASLVWDMNFDSDTNVVDVAVRRLRVKLDDGFADKLLHTVWGVGYVFESRRELGELG